MTEDRIEREMHIVATPEQVWRVVSLPGWWINEGELHPEWIRRDGDVGTVDHPKFGEFRVVVAEERPPEYVRFRWLSRDADWPVPETTVEFTLTPDRGGVLVRVVESGFEQGRPGPRLDEHYRDNCEGWESELDALRQSVSDAADTRR